MLSELIEQFCTLGVEEQDRLECQGEQMVDSYNNLFDPISVRQRVPLIGDTLYNVHNQETGTVLTDDMIDRLGADLSNRYIECAMGQQQFDSSHDTVTSLNKKYGDNESICVKIKNARTILKNYEDKEKQLMSTLKTYEERNSNIEKEDQMQAFKEKNKNSASGITLMPSEKIIHLLNILTRTNAKLNTIMSGQMSDIERSNEIENVVDTVS